MDRTKGFKLEQLNKLLEKSQGNVEITTLLFEYKNKYFIAEEIDKIETEKWKKNWD